MSSSIFSSERLRRYLGLSRAERRFHALLAVVGVAVFVLGHGLTAGVDRLLLPFSHLAPFVLARQSISERTRVVFAGSSNVFLGIRPTLLSFDAVNVAGPGWDYSAVEAALRANLDRMPGLELAVIELDPLPFRMDSSEVLRGHCRALRLWGIGEDELPCRDTDVPPGAFGAIAAALVPDFRLTPHEIWETIEARVTDPPNIRRPIPGNRSFYSTMTPEEAARYVRGRVRWLATAFSGRDRRRNERALGRAVTLLVERDVEVVFLRLPHQSVYLSRLPELWESQDRRTLARLRRATGEPLPVWSYETHPRFEPSHFLDAVHLNASGNEQLTTLLDGRIRRHLAGGGGGTAAESGAAARGTVR